MSGQCYLPDDAPPPQAARPGPIRLPEPGRACRLKLSFSIFFDGTRNNKYVDMADGSGSFSNVARLFEACEEDDLRGIHRLYVQGVGTEFREIGEVPRHERGASMGAMGAERIRYAFLYVVNRVSYKVARSLIVPETPREIARFVSSESNLDRWRRQLTHRLTQSRNPTIDEIVFDVIGFSRGATAARSFVNQLNKYFCDVPGYFCGVPMRVRFLGLFDTVASVGLADSVPGPVEGHQGWGDESLLTIPKVDQCVHLVAAHEARNSFPVDIIRKRGGGYPDNCVEIVYPGMHSDVGGGYGNTSQGKGTRNGSGRPRQEGQDKISQIALNDMYERALAAGVPLRDRQGLEDVRIADYFAVAPEVRQSFNAYMAQVRPECQGKRVEEHLLAHRRRYLGWRKQVLTQTMFEQLHFVRASEAQDAINLREANAGLIGHLHAIDTFPQRQREHTIRTASRPNPRPLEPPIGYAFRDDWAQAPSPTPEAVAFFEQYVHDSRAHFLLTDPQGDDDHADIHRRLEEKDRQYQEALKRHRELMRDFYARGERTGYTSTTLPYEPRDPLNERERRNLETYRAGSKPLFSDANPASSEDGQTDLIVNAIAAMHGRREGNWTYLHKRQVFAYSRVNY